MISAPSRFLATTPPSTSFKATVTQEYIFKHNNLCQTSFFEINISLCRFILMSKDFLSYVKVVGYHSNVKHFYYLSYIKKVQLSPVKERHFSNSILCKIHFFISETENTQSASRQILTKQRIQNVFYFEIFHLLVSKDS